MHITEQEKAEIMEIAADDQMKHAEAPSDEEMEQMFHHMTMEEIVEENRKSAEREAEEQARKDGYRLELLAEAMFRPQFHRPRYNHELTSAENRAEQLADIERGNVEASNEHHYDE